MSQQLLRAPARTQVSAAAPVTAVDRRAGLSKAEFVREYRNPGRPVILTDATRAWPALGKFTPSFFREQLGDRAVTIRGERHRLRDFLDRLERSTPDNPAPYPCKLDLRTDFADLAADVAPRLVQANPDRVHSPLLMKKLLLGLNDLEIFIGGPGGEFPYLHYDFLGLYAYINQIYGEKEFTILTPDQTEFVYPDPVERWMSRIENHHDPDYAKYPLFANARPTKVILGPGETLFIPSGWWHTARSLTLSISVAFDQLCASNWRFFTRECLHVRRASPLKRALVRASLAFAGTILTVGERLSAQD